MHSVFAKSLQFGAMSENHFGLLWVCFHFEMALSAHIYLPFRTACPHVKWSGTLAHVFLHETSAMTLLKLKRKLTRAIHFDKQLISTLETWCKCGCVFQSFRQFDSFLLPSQIRTAGNWSATICSGLRRRQMSEKIWTDINNHACEKLGRPTFLHQCASRQPHPYRNGGRLSREQTRQSIQRESASNAKNCALGMLSWLHCWDCFTALCLKKTVNTAESCSAP